MRSKADTPASLFIYFKLSASRAPQALQRLAAMQDGLRSRHPGLTARLLARTDGRDVAEPTWMEIYEHPQGLSESFLADLEAALPRFNYAIVLNRFDARKGMAHEANAALNSHPRLDTVVRSLSAYEKVFGGSPTELAQFREIWDEILGAMGGPA